MKLKSLGPHCHELEADGLSVLFSYATPVAYHEQGRGYFRTSTRHSPTTSRHVNAWIGNATAAQVPQAILDGLRIVVLEDRP